MTAILRLQLDDKDPVRVNSAINQLAEYSDRNTRSKLTPSSATTFYVSTSGNDINSGSQASPFLTIQHAYDFIANSIDLGGQNVTIQCASGTYTAGLNISTPWTGGGTITLDIGSGTISTSASCIVVTCGIPTVFVVANGTLTSSGGHCIDHAGAGLITIGGGMKFGSAPNGGHMASEGFGSKISSPNSYAIIASAYYHYVALRTGNSIVGFGSTVTITGTPAFNVFAYAFQTGSVDIEGRTFSGGATGTRYFAESNAVIATGGGGANYFPGSIAGFTSTGGQYL